MKLLTCVLLGLLTSTAFASPKVGKASWVTVSSEMAIEAPVDRVWAELTSADGLAALTGDSIERKGARFEKPGDWSPGKIWDDKGTFVVTYAEAKKELRVYFEPNAGHYACHFTIRLTAEGKKTKVTLKDAYSDEKPADVDKNAAEVAKRMAQNEKSFSGRFKK